VGVLILQSVITCPHCGAQARETMPEDTCRRLYRCAACGELSGPLSGDCCVFCSYADQVCPPKQTGNDACC
jgi:hypothetical protein